MKINVRIVLCVVLFVTISIPTMAQDVALGTPPFASLGGGPDVINLGNLNATLQIPILNNPGRGLNMTYSLSYDSSIWYPVTSGSTKSWQPSSTYGWQGLTPANTGGITYAMTYSSGNCGQYGTGTYQEWTFGNVVYTDNSGTVHNVPAGGAYFNSTGGTACPPNGANPAGTVKASLTDGSGLTAYYSVNPGYMSIYLVTATGTTLNPPINASPTTSSEIDSNGNEITSTNGAYTDTLGNASVLKVVGAAPETDISYLTPAGTYAAYKVTFKQYNIHTYFQCSSINEYTATGVYLVDKVTLPDSTYYQFQYEATSAPGYSGYYSGRVASVTLPTGGTITYAYTGGNQNTGIECMDGSTAKMTRTLSPGGQWTYARTPVSGTSPQGSKWTTTVTDPAGNNSVINFAEDAATTNGTYNLYPTQQQVYQGAVSPSNLKLTTVTCYNASFTNCATATVSSPVAQTDTYSVLPNNATRLSELIYNSFGLATTDNEFDFGVTQGAAPGTSHLIQQTNVGYSTNNKPGQVTVNDWTSGSAVQLASTTYSYDQTAVTATTGTPQHVSPPLGYRGNLTTIAQAANGSTTLYQTFSYYDTGNLSSSNGLSTSSTSPGPTTTYQYGSGSCGNSFVTQSNGPLSLSRSFLWNCVGGVQAQVTDENGQPVKTTYTDAEFWRPANAYDQQNNETIFSYNGQTSSSSTMTFNNNHSVSGILATVDGFGRPILSQTLQAPGASNYDTAETDYNSIGLPNRNTMPFSAGAGGTSSSAPGVTQTFDVLGRPLISTDSDGGTVNLSYTNNDVLQTVSGSQSFKKQYEYDGLGRLSSVCEISTSLPGVGTCGQSATQTGYWTKYTYDALGHLLTVTQNAQAASGSQQHRIYSYDKLGRVTSESNPETSNTGSNGTTTYTYDVACTTTAASPGDLTRRVDNAGNNTCYGYDSLHRPNAQGWNTVCRFFAYDNTVTPPTGVTVQNTKSRLLEAWTTNCGSTQYTDEWFSYSARGELTDVYEKTPHSGSNYYHTTATYWASGALATLSGIPSVPTLYYGASNGAGLDGEGRYTQVTASSSPNPVTAVTYSTSSTSNPLGALTGVTYGSSDSDSFTYDPNTGRPSTYTFSVNGNNDSGTLGWNTNGTLASLAISDTIPGTSDSQSCTFSYDDLSRSSGASCGSKGTQSFSYDPFGNISKTANGLGLSFQPTSYNTSNQPVVSGMSFNANGNATTDNVGNQYTWDPNWGAASSVNSVTVTADAFGRVVEQGSGSAYSEMLWSPVGKVAILSGTTLTKALVSLPGRGTAAYTTSGLAYYRHADWVGSSRLASTQARGLYSSSSYAPFGEQYATAGTSDASFTGQNSDTVSSLYDFRDRRFSPSQGRWVSPDPVGMSAVDPANPQSWNRYAYVLNNPLFYFDPFGDSSDPSLCDLTGGWICGNTGAAGGGGGYAELETESTIFTATYTSSDGKNTYIYQNGSWIEIDANGNSTPLTQIAVQEVGLPTSFASFSYSSLLFGASTGESGTGAGSNSGGKGGNNPYYFAALCKNEGLILTTTGCTYTCIAAETSVVTMARNWTIAGIYFTRKQIWAACQPKSQMFCPNTLVVEGTANELGGTTDANIISCYSTLP